MHRSALLVWVAWVALAGCTERVHHVDPGTDPKCGDGTIDQAQGEVCDGSDLGGATCESQGFDTGALLCGTDCQLVTTSCHKRCGDAVVESGEACDGDAGLTSCPSFGYRACTATCTRDDRSCVGTWFESGPAATVAKGGPSVLLDLPPLGLGELAVAVKEYARVEVLPYTLDRGFLSSRKLAFDRAPVAVLAVDFDRDGQGEVLALEDDGSLDRYLPAGASYERRALPDGGCPSVALVGEGRRADGGSIVAAVACPTDAGANAAWLQWPGGQRQVAVPAGSAVALGDVDGDGQSDLLALAPGATDAVPFLAPGFAAGAAMPLGAAASTLRVIDLDGDGDGDLVTEGPGGVQLFENTGAAFAPRGQLGTARAPLVFTGDLDLDGRADVAFFAAGMLELRRQTAPFTFSSVSLQVPSGQPLSLSAGDLDGDGDLDLALTLAQPNGDGVTAIFLDKVR